MMDNRTTNNVGQFYWWFGVVEDREDPLRMGRCRVRIMGYHIENKEILPTEDLPWAFPIMPANNPSISGTGTSSNGVVTGTWVIGFFADGSDGQHPMFFGTVGAVPGGPYPDPCAPAGGNSVSEGAPGESGAPGGVESGQDTPITSGPPQQEFWTLVAMCACEAGLNKSQGQCDVAQSIYNRAASGAYGSRNILGIMLARGQYESSWRFPSASGGNTPNGYWRNITDARTAAMAAGRGTTVAQMQQVAQNLKNAQMQAEAKRFIGPRTDFLGSNQPAKAMTSNGTKVQRDGQSNKFGFSFNYRGKAVGSPPASVTSGG
jgi:hypothetical protein